MHDNLLEKVCESLENEEEWSVSQNQLIHNSKKIAIEKFPSANSAHFVKPKGAILSEEQRAILGEKTRSFFDRFLEKSLSSDFTLHFQHGSGYFIEFDSGLILKTKITGNYPKSRVLEAPFLKGRNFHQWRDRFIDAIMARILEEIKNNNIEWIGTKIFQVKGFGFSIVENSEDRFRSREYIIPKKKIPTKEILEILEKKTEDTFVKALELFPEPDPDDFTVTYKAPRGAFEKVSIWAIIAIMTLSFSAISWVFYPF